MNKLSHPIVRFPLVALALLFIGPLALGARAPGIEGIYVGNMKLDLEKPTTLPLQLALSTTGETVIQQIGPQVFEERMVIDGAFLVDDEGGPYGVGHVTYNLDLSEIDMRYDRKDATIGQVPASLRFDGKVDAQGNILGRVISGLGGVIGTFDLKRSDLKVLKVTKKYQGVWSGEGKALPGGYGVALEIGLGNSLQPRINPPNYELFYTPGKMGYISWNYQKAPFADISIDYLRRRIVFSDSDSVDVGQVATAECEIDPVTDELVGTLYGVYRGKVATFRLKKKHY